MVVPGFGSASSSSGMLQPQVKVQQQKNDEYVTVSGWRPPVGKEDQVEQEHEEDVLHLRRWPYRTVHRQLEVQSCHCQYRTSALRQGYWVSAWQIYAFSPCDVAAATAKAGET